MMIALPNIDGSFTCTLFLASEGTPFPLSLRVFTYTSGNPSFASLDTKEKVDSFFKEQFPDAYLTIEQYM